MEFVVPISIILLLVLANGLFVAAEFAIVGASRTAVGHQASEGSRLAARVTRILDDPKLQDRYIATTQIGITAASLGLGMYGEQVLAGWIETHLEFVDQSGWITAHVIATVVAVSALTYLHIVIGEMVPKALALQRADRTALLVSPLIEALERAVLPLVLALNALGNRVLRVIGVQRGEVETERYRSTEELQLIIQESHEGGMLRGESGRILRELLEFGDLTAGQVLVPRVHLVGIPMGVDAEQLRTIVRTHPHTRYPVYAGDMDNIIGSVHIKDLLRHLVSDRPVSARDARPLPYVPATAPLDEVLAAMRRARAQIAVVMDEQGGTAGLLTIEDLFEEVVGDSEEGRGRKPIATDSAGRLMVRGTVALRDAGDALGVTIEYPHVQTVSGFVLALLGRAAALGDVVTWHNVRIEVAAVSGRGVQDAVIEKIDGAT